MLTSSERDERMTKLRQLPHLIEEAVKDLDETQLATAVGDDPWTIQQVVHHLADAHLNGFVRMKLILTEERPPLKAFDQDAWAQLPDAAAPLQTSLAILNGLHERWWILLQGLPATSWQRVGLHSERGELTIDDLLVTHTNHGDAHLEQIRRLREATATHH